MSRLKILEKALKDLCVLMHTEDSCLNESYSEDKLANILAMSSAEAVVHIKQTVIDLIEMKKKALVDPAYHLLAEHDSYQKAMQKLDTEVRNHIKAEHQLKLFIDDMQQQIEEIDKTNDQLRETYTKQISDLETEILKLNQEINHREREIRQAESEREKEELKTFSRLRPRDLAESTIKKYSFDTGSEDRGLSVFKKKYEAICNRYSKLQKTYQKLKAYEGKRPKSVSPSIHKDFNQTKTKERRPTQPGGSRKIKRLPMAYTARM